MPIGRVKYGVDHARPDRRGSIVRAHVRVRGHDPTVSIASVEGVEPAVSRETAWMSFRHREADVIRIRGEVDDATFRDHLSRIVKQGIIGNVTKPGSGYATRLRIVVLPAVAPYVVVGIVPTPALLTIQLFAT